MIEKGFSKPTDRIMRLKKQIIDARPHVESERAVLATQAYKETEGLPPILRRAKVVEKIFNELPVTIRDDELVVGAITKNPRSTEICPEFSFDWVEKEFETMATRMADPFEIPKQTADELREAFKYWPGRTTSDLASSYMSQKAKDCIANGVFTVGNYFLRRRRPCLRRLWQDPQYRLQRRDCRSGPAPRSARPDGSVLYQEAAIL